MRRTVAKARARAGDNNNNVSLAYETLLFTNTLTNFFPESSSHHHDKETSLEFESHDFDDFEADRQLEEADDWVNDEYTAQLTEKHLSKVSETMAVEVNPPSFRKGFNTNFVHRDRRGRIQLPLMALPLQW